jgi:hypothetical protein
MPEKGWAASVAGLPRNGSLCVERRQKIRRMKPADLIQI